MEHEWLSPLPYISGQECTCGFRPNSQDEMDDHFVYPHIQESLADWEKELRNVKIY